MSASLYQSDVYLLTFIQRQPLIYLRFQSIRLYTHTLHLDKTIVSHGILMVYIHYTRIWYNLLMCVVKIEMQISPKTAVVRLFTE